MKLLQLSSILLMAICCFSACESTDTPEPEMDERPILLLGDSSILKIGDEIRIDETDVSLTALDVTEDSRCPEGVECFFEGRGVVEFSVSETEDIVIELILQAGQEELASETVGTYTYTLLDLSPYPVAEETIEKEDYEIKIKVEQL